MVRIDNGGPNVDAWYVEQAGRVGNGTSTFDLCRECYEELADGSVGELGLEPYNGDPVGTESNDIGAGPDYEDCYLCGDHLQCDACNKVLRERDQ